MSAVGWVRFAALASLLSLAASGCGFAAQNVPLPGRGVSGETHRVSALFTDALNLAEGAPVRLNGATVGQVQRVSIRNYRARVDMTVQTAARLHGGAAARLRGTTPLGELYVDLDDGTSPNFLADGATLTESTVAPTIEDTMATTSLFLNGGGITELGTIIRESNRAFGGREERAQGLLRRLDRTTAELQASTAELDQALASLASLSLSLRERRATIRAALREVGPTATALESQIEDLSTLLAGIERFGAVTSGVIDTVQADLVRSLRQLGPIFDQMNALEGDLTPAIEQLVAFSKALDRAVPTQYLNTDLHIHLDGVSGPAAPAADATAGPVAARPGPAVSATPSPPPLVPIAPQVGSLVDSQPLIETIRGLLKGLQP